MVFVVDIINYSYVNEFTELKFDVNALSTLSFSNSFCGYFGQIGKNEFQMCILWTDIAPYAEISTNERTYLIHDCV